MNFGGAFQFGAGQFGGDPFGLKAGYVIRRIMSELSRFKKVTVAGVTTGCVQTIGMLTGPVDDPQTLDLMIREGLPAFLVGHPRSDFESRATDELTFTESAKFAIVCVAEHLHDRVERLEGRNVYRPGLFNLSQWAVVYGLRGLRDLQSRLNYKPISKRFARFAAERFVSIVEIECNFTTDVQDDVDTFGPRLERLGIVHNPVDLSALFLPDNLTPNGDYHSVYIGVAELDDE